MPFEKPAEMIDLKTKLDHAYIKHQTETKDQKKNLAAYSAINSAFVTCARFDEFLEKVNTAIAALRKGVFWETKSPLADDLQQALTNFFAELTKEAKPQSKKKRGRRGDKLDTYDSQEERIPKKLKSKKSTASVDETELDYLISQLAPTEAPAEDPAALKKELAEQKRLLDLAKQEAKVLNRTVTHYETENRRLKEENGELNETVIQLREESRYYEERASRLEEINTSRAYPKTPQSSARPRHPVYTTDHKGDMRRHLPLQRYAVLQKLNDALKKPEYTEHRRAIILHIQKLTVYFQKPIKELYQQIRPSTPFEHFLQREIYNSTPDDIPFYRRSFTPDREGYLLEYEVYKTLLAAAKKGIGLPDDPGLIKDLTTLGTGLIKSKKKPDTQVDVDKLLGHTAENGYSHTQKVA